MKAYVKTDNPNSITTISNTFDMTKYFNISNDKRNRQALSATTNTFKTVKF